MNGGGGGCCHYCVARIMNTNRLNVSSTSIKKQIKHVDWSIGRSVVDNRSWLRGRYVVIDDAFTIASRAAASKLNYIRVAHEKWNIGNFYVNLCSIVVSSFVLPEVCFNYQTAGP